MKCCEGHSLKIVGFILGSAVFFTIGVLKADWSQVMTWPRSATGLLLVVGTAMECDLDDELDAGFVHGAALESNGLPVVYDCHFCWNWSRYV